MSTTSRAAKAGFASAAITALLACSPPVLETGPRDLANLQEVFERLHRPIYRLYEGPLDRDRLWHSLAESFEGEALTDEYVDHFLTFSQMLKEDTAIEIVRVDYESFEFLGTDPLGMRVGVDWSVGGVVRHQGHRHPRVNRYKASYTLAHLGQPGQERIVDSALQHLERVQGLDDRAFPLDDLPTSARGFLGPAEMLRTGLFDEPAEQPLP